MHISLDETMPESSKTPKEFHIIKALVNATCSIRGNSLFAMLLPKQAAHRNGLSKSSSLLLYDPHLPVDGDEADLENFRVSVHLVPSFSIQTHTKAACCFERPNRGFSRG